MRVRWEVGDGYVGKSRPQYTTIDDEEFEGLTDKEREELIHEYVQHDFDQKITWDILGYEE